MFKHPSKMSDQEFQTFLPAYLTDLAKQRYVPMDVAYTLQESAKRLTPKAEKRLTRRKQ